MDDRASVLAIASRQHNVFALSQAVGVGIPARTVQHWANEASVTRIFHSIYAIGGIEIGWTQREYAAQLAVPPGVASRMSAKAVFEIGPAPLEPQMSVGPKRSARRKGIDVRRVARVERTSHHGFRVTTPMRTLLDNAPSLCDDELEKAVHNFHRRGLISPPRFETYLRPYCDSRTPGARRLLHVVSFRTGDRPIASDLQADFFILLRKHGLPTPIPEYGVMTPNGQRYIDFAYPNQALALEVDGWEWHGTREAFESDRIRRNELEVLRWHVLQITKKAMREDPVGLCSMIGAGLGLVPVRWR